MNILFISPSSPRESIGGIERYISNLIDYCKSQPDIKAKILLPTYDKESVEEDGNVSLCFSNDLAMVPNISAVEASAKARSFAKTVERIISEDKIDIICAENFHLGFPPAFGIILNVIGEINKVPLVLRLHSFATTDLQKELINQLMWRKISSVSMSVSGDCFEKGASIDALSTNYLGVDTKKFNNKALPNNVREEAGIGRKDKIVLTACRIIDDKKNILTEKGIINLVESFSKISPHYPNLRLLVAVARPPKSLENEFKIALEILKGHIRLRVVAGQTIVKVFGLAEMPDVYRESDLFVLASQNETFGQVFIESMACDLPVIGTKVGGIPEIISDSYNGYLVLPDDASVLAQRIESILNDNSVRKHFIENGRRTVKEKFTLEKQFGSFMEMLKSLIKA